MDITCEQMNAMDRLLEFRFRTDFPPAWAERALGEAHDDLAVAFVDNVMTPGAWAELAAVDGRVEEGPEVVAELLAERGLKAGELTRCLTPLVVGFAVSACRAVPVSGEDLDFIGVFRALRDNVMDWLVEETDAGECLVIGELWRELGEPAAQAELAANCGLPALRALLEDRHGRRTGDWVRDPSGRAWLTPWLRRRAEVARRRASMELVTEET